MTIRQSRWENTRVLLQSRCHNMAIRNSMITSRTGNPFDHAVIYSPFWDVANPPQSFTVVGSTVRGGTLFIAIDGGDVNPPAASVG